MDKIGNFRQKSIRRSSQELSGAILHSDCFADTNSFT